MTHRMGSGETLTKAAGEKLGKALRSFEGQARFIELDIEPLPEPGVLKVFLQGVKEKFGPDLKLTLATPFLSPRKTEAISWDQTQFEQTIPLVDGLEVMVYDTGAQTEAQYLAHFENALNAVETWKERYPQKVFTVGVPAYPDKTKLHLPQVENLSVIAKSKLLEKFPSARLAIYAGWTMTEKDHSVSTTVKSSAFR